MNNVKSIAKACERYDDNYTADEYERLIRKYGLNELKRVLEESIDKNILIEVYPHKGEKKKDFISRFMSVTKDEYPDLKQRFAICMSY